MTNKRIAGFFLGAMLAVLAACGGGGGGSASAPAPTGPNKVAGSATLVIPNPTTTATTQSAKRKPSFVSSAVVSAAIAVNGTITVTADVSSTSTLCTVVNTTSRACNIAISAPAGNDFFTVYLFDGANGTGHTLGVGNATQTISGTSFKLPIVVGGVVSKFVLSAPGQMLTIGTPATIPITVVPQDAAGQTILTDDYASPLTVNENDTSGHTHLSTNTLVNPQTALSLGYDGGALNASSIVINGSGANAALVTVTPVTIQVAAAPTPSPISSVPGFSFTGLNYSCTGPAQVNTPGTTLIFISAGRTDSTGNYAQDFGEWAPFTVATPSFTPSPTPTPTVTPTPTPTPTSSPTLIAYIFLGEFTLNQAYNGMTNGCMLVIYEPSLGTTAPSAYSRRPQGAVVASPTPAPNSTPVNSEYIGFPNLGPNVVFSGVGTVGYITTTSLTLNPTAGTGSGTFTLDNGTSGTISLTAVDAYTNSAKRQQQAQQIRAMFDAARHRTH